MILQKLLLYSLSIAVIAFIYVYKIPIFCSECEKPRGFSKNLFRCVVDEEKLCSVHHELNSAKEYAINFMMWLKDVVVNEIPGAVLKEIQKIYELLEPIKEALKSILDKITQIFSTIKKEFIDKVTKVFTDLATNVSNMFINIKDGTVNMANLIYQSIDNIRYNAVLKIKQVIKEIGEKIQTAIIDPINSLVKQMGEVFTQINNFFSGLASKIIQPFKDFYEMLKKGCIPEIPILPNSLQIFPEIKIDLLKVDLKAVTIPSVKIPKFCPFDALADAFAKITEGIQTAFDKMLEPLTGPFKALAASITAFKKTIENGITDVKNFINDKITEVQNYIITAFEPIKTFFTKLGNDISDAYTKTKDFIINKLTELKDKIIKFFIDSLDQFKKELYKLFEPVINLVQKVWESFTNVYKNFIASLNNLYILVKEKWNIVYKLVYDRIFYIAYIYYISFADNFVQYFFTPAWFIPMSRTVKINIFNGVLVTALLGALLYFYTTYTIAISRILGAVLTGIGDLYGIVDSVAGMVDQYIIPQIYTSLTVVPTLTFAMDTLSYLSPSKIIPQFLSYILYSVEFIVGFFKDIIGIFPTTTYFVSTLIIIICILISQYFSSNGISRFNILINNLKSAYEYIFKKVDTTEIKKLQTEVIDKSKKEPVIEPVKPAMEGVMGEFQTKMDNFKKRVDLIEEIRKSYAAKPEDKDNPKVLEMNLDTMIRKLNNEISSRGL